NNLATTADNGQIIKIHGDGLGLKLGAPANPFINIQNATIDVLVTPQGIGAKVVLAPIPANTINLPGITFAATSLTVEINTSTLEINEKFDDGLGGVATLTLPAGPFTRVVLLGATLTLGTDSGSPLTGNFFFDSKTNPDGTK